MPLVGKEERLSFLLLYPWASQARPMARSRYQLLHRERPQFLRVSAIVRLRRSCLCIPSAKSAQCWSDYQAFLKLFEVGAEVGAIQRLPGAQRVPLFAAWVLGDCRFLSA